MTETFRIRNPEDLLAAVPLVLGFHPTDSLVMLTFPTRGRAFHARVDLAADDEERQETALCLLDAALRNRVDRVLFVAYGDDAALAREALFTAHDVFDAEDLDVIDLLWADGLGWESLVSDRHGEHPAGTHPFAARAVLEGRVTLASRAALEATVRPVPAQVEDCRAAMEGLGDTGPDVRGAVQTVHAHVHARTRPDDTAAARLLRDCGDDAVWHALWLLPDREAARGHADLWADLVRRSPEEWVAAPAALLAHTAWLSGDGALAWCAVDRCREAGEGHPGAEVVAGLLADAVPPSRWEDVLGEPA